ncbi:MAG TPA: cytochrome c biogenesis protein CcsA [Verrucomicrobiae bacterium]|jgi:hypothetical protein|nr:cytochrome c biogenesis protein CcsA [Verrucomicrobiae bacterium]
MFNLEQSIAEWRRQMLAAGLKSPTPLNELESHLREDMRGLLATTEAEALAFQLAVLRLGNPGPLRTEFNKLESTACWPARMGYWLYAGAMILMAAFIYMSSWLYFGAGKMGLLPHPFLLYAHVVSLTAGYCAAFFAGCLGICYVCYRFLHTLSPAREQSLDSAARLFAYLATGLTFVGISLGLIWTKRQFGGHFAGDLREFASICAFVWLVALCVTRRISRVTGRARMLMCIAGNVIVSLAWFGPFVLIHGTAGYWPLAIFLGMNLIFLVMGMAPVLERAES